jgi:hypothetical protein
MNARRVALGGTLALIAVLFGLTVDVMLKSGIDVLVLLSLGIVGMVGVGVIGALFNPPDE